MPWRRMRSDPILSVSPSVTTGTPDRCACTCTVMKTASNASNAAARRTIEDSCLNSHRAKRDLSRMFMGFIPARAEMTSSPTSADIGAKTDPITRGALSHKLACSSHRRTTTWRFESWNGGRRSRAGCTPSWTPPKSGGAQPSARQAREQLALLALSARIDDTSLLDDIERNTDELEERSRERTRADRPPAPTPRPIILTVRAGAGGRDAQAFAARLLRMYVRYAQRTRTRHTLLHAEHTDAGTRSATLRVHPRPGQRWHTEHGVHRITHLSGVGSGRGRRHTSFVAVEALEEPAPAETPTIAREAVRIDVFRGSGPGG